MLANPGPDRGRTNVVMPSTVRVSMEQSLGSEHRADLMSRIAMPRFRGAEEVAAMVSWLCGPNFMFSTGILFDPSGGRSIW
jgi:3-oxoacyl-[acyl-carrier protein] reductase